LACALNEGLKYCSFDLIMRMDTDDVSLANRFEQQVGFMRGNPDISVLSGFIEEWNEDFSLKLDTRRLPLLNERIVMFSKYRCPISHPAAAFRKKAVLSVGGYPSIYPEDYPLWCNMLSQGHKMANLQSVLLKMRTGDSFMSRRGREFFEGEIKVFRYLAKIGYINRFQLYLNILSRVVLRFSSNPVRKFLYKTARWI